MSLYWVQCRKGKDIFTYFLFVFWTLRGISRPLSISVGAIWQNWYLWTYYACFIASWFAVDIVAVLSVLGWMNGVKWLANLFVHNIYELNGGCVSVAIVNPKCSRYTPRIILSFISTAYFLINIQSLKQNITKSLHTQTQTKTHTDKYSDFPSIA